MKMLQDLIDLIGELPIWVPVLLGIIVFIGIVGQWALYEKCDLPGYSCLVPVWNVIVFLKIVGRPTRHAWMVMLPPVFMILPFALWNFEMLGLIPASVIAAVFFLPWAYFMTIIYTEICQSFGKLSKVSYVLIVIFNGLYLFNLALSQDEKYRGPVYKEKN